MTPKYLTIICVIILFKLVLINCQRFYPNRHRVRNGGSFGGSFGGTVRPLDQSLMSTEMYDRRTTMRRRRDPTYETTVISARRRPPKGTEVINVNVKVKDRNRNRNNRRFRRRRNRFNRFSRLPPNPPTLFDRLRLLFNPSRYGLSPFFQRMFRPYSYNFENRFPNRGRRRRGRPLRDD